MESHVRILGLMLIVMGLLGGILALVVLSVFDGFSGLIGMADAGGGSSALLPIAGFLGGGLVVLLLALAGPCVAAGLGLLRFRSWARSLSMILAVLQLVNFPVGTLLALYAFWVLLAQETEMLFSSPPRSG